MNLRVPCAVLLLVYSLAAQQPNTTQASLVINNTIGPPYPITGVSLPRGHAQNVMVGSANPNAPFVLFGGPGLVLNGYTVLGGSILQVDIFTAGYFVVLDGIANPAVINTGPTGTFDGSAVVPATATIGTQAAFQCVVADPSVPVYATRLTAATQVVVSQGLTVIPISTPPNGGALFDFVPYGMTFPYYSNTYTRMFVNTDGNVTFGSASGDFSPTPPEFRAQQPRIAPMWTDLDQSYQGASITVTVDQSAFSVFPTITVDWIQMAERLNSGARHTFQLVMNMTTGDITINHDPLNVAMGYEQLMGISPGNGIVPDYGWSAQKDLSALPRAPYLSDPNESFWEWFGLNNASMPLYTAGFHNPWDMTGTTTLFIAVSAGFPGIARYYGT